MTLKMQMEWQGIFENLERTSSKLLKIGHLTGNEENLIKVIDSVKQSTFFKKYLNNDGLRKFSTEAHNILKLFIANTKFNSKNLSQIEEYSHLVNTLPVLSQCILANIIIQLDLTENFCALLLDLPIQLTSEMLQEIGVYLKFFVPEKRLEYTFAYLKTIITVIKSLDDQDNLHLTKMLNHFNEFMKNLPVAVPAEDLDVFSESEKTDVMQSYGYTILYLYRLMQECPLENKKFGTILTELINICDAMLTQVVLEVYASWEEVSFDDLSLQDAVAIEAYEVKNQLKDYEPAKEMLIKIFSSRSREDVTMNSMKVADVSTIVKNVSKGDQYQKLWFETLLKNENVFDSTDSIDCLNTWMKMFTREDISIFMAHPKRGEKSANKSLILECIKILNVTDVKLFIQDYYHEHEVGDVPLEMDINGQLNPLLNKITSTEVEENVMKDIYVLLLLNPRLTLQMFCDRCLQNTVFVTGLAGLFEFIKSIPRMAECFKHILGTTLLSNAISTINYTNYIDLMNLMLNLDYFSKYDLISNILMPQVESLYQKENDGLLYMLLQMLNNICEDIDDEIPLPLIDILIKIIDSARTSSLNFSFSKQHMLESAIELLLKLTPKIKPTLRSHFTDTFSKLEKKHGLTKYYCDKIINDKLEDSFFGTYCDYDISAGYNVRDMVALLIMILPQSVSKEWMLIVKELQSIFDNKNVLKLLTETLQTLCEFTATLSNNTSQTDNLKWCLDQYLIIMKELFQSALEAQEDTYLLTKNVMYLLAYLGEDFTSYGLKFVDLIPPENFLLLKEDRKLVFLLLTFKDRGLADVLAKRMLNYN